MRRTALLGGRGLPGGTSGRRRFSSPDTQVIATVRFPEPRRAVRELRRTDMRRRGGKIAAGGNRHVTRPRSLVLFLLPASRVAGGDEQGSSTSLYGYRLGVWRHAGPAASSTRAVSNSVLSA